MNRRQKPYPSTSPDLPVQYAGEEPSAWRERLLTAAAVVLIFMAVVATSTVAVVLYLKYGGGYQVIPQVTQQKQGKTNGI